VSEVMGLLWPRPYAEVNDIMFYADKKLQVLLYVQVTVHCDKLRIKQPTRYIRYPKFILS
jgi:hypothetical protein